MPTLKLIASSITKRDEPLSKAKYAVKTKRAWRLIEFPSLPKASSESWCRNWAGLYSVSPLAFVFVAEVPLFILVSCWLSSSFELSAKVVDPYEDDSDPGLTLQHTPPTIEDVRFMPASVDRVRRHLRRGFEKRTGKGDWM